MNSTCIPEGGRPLKKKIFPVLAAVVLLAALAALGWHVSSCRETYVFIDGNRYRRDTAYLDLSGGPVDQLERLTEFHTLKKLNLRKTGLTVAQYDILRQAFPNCEIQWSLLFQGNYYSDSTTSLVITELSDEDVALLDYLPNLRSVNAVGCDDYPQLLALQARRPECAIFYDVSLGGETWPQDTRNLTLSDADGASLLEQLAFLPQVENVLLTGILPSTAEIDALKEAYPQIAFLWQVEICGITADPAATELDLSGIAVEDVSVIEAALPYLPQLEKVIMCDCGVSNEEMDALNRRHENIRFIWTVDIGPELRLRTDATAFIPIKWGVWLTDEDCENLRYCTEMVCLDLGHHDITRCDFVAYMPHLKYLVLADTPISDITPLTDRKELIFLELFMTDVTDYSPLLTLTGLEDLNLCYTYGSAQVIAQMTWLKRLWWSPNGGWKQPLLTKSLPDTMINVTTGSSTGGEWRKGQNYYDMRDMLGMYYMTG